MDAALAAQEDAKPEKILQSEGKVTGLHTNVQPSI